MIPEQVPLMAACGFRLVPIGAGSKHPPIDKWPELASADPVTHESWWGLHPEWGVGWKMGAQDDGRWLFAIDVDVNKGGRESFKDLVAEFGLEAEFKSTATARTGGGGWHFVFELPRGYPWRPTNRARLRAGIDVRAEAGQIVVAPTIHPVSGLAYCWDKEPWVVRPARASGPLMHMMQSLAAPPPPVLSVVGDVERSVARHPSQQMSPGDFVRARWDWSSYLLKHGWVALGGEAWRRPGKSDKGSSAQLKNTGQGPLNIFTTEVPVEVSRLGRLDRSGQCVSLSLFDFIAAYEFGGDRSALGRHVAQDPQFVAEARPMVAAAPAAGGADDAATKGDVTSLNLPAEFWSERPALAQIRQAAWSAGCSPDALLVQTLARVATFVHPCFKLPGVEQGLIGKHQTLDFLGCVVAETSGGKTLAAGVAELFVPAPEPPSDGSDPLIDFDQKVGSGEGIPDFFLVPQTIIDPDTEKERRTGKKVIGKQALFMNVDEGTGFTNQAGRKGTTIIATLASAWSGESLGQLNAADETRRLVRGGRVRICAVINMQDSNGWKLYTDDLESVGFTGRLLFASAHDPEAPRQPPKWPGRLVWPIRGGSATSTSYFTYAPEIVEEILETRHGVLTKRVQIDRRQSQYLLLRCKVAALLAVIDGRLDVSVDDWRLATSIIGTSSRMLEHLDITHGTQIEQVAVTSATFKMRVAETAEAAHLRRLAVGWKPRVLEEIRTKGPLSWKGLKGLVRSDRRTMFRSIVDEMVNEGILVRNGTTYEIA